MSDDPILTHYRLMTDAQRREELAKDGITEEWRRKLVIVIGENEAAEAQERSAMERRQTSIAERAASAAEAAAAEARSARIIAIAALIIATMLSAPMIAVAQALIRFLH